MTFGLSSAYYDIIFSLFCYDVLFMSERFKQAKWIRSIDYARGGNTCRWVVFVSCQCTDRVNIRQPKPDTNNKRVNIANPNPTHLLFVLGGSTRI